MRLGMGMRLYDLLRRASAGSTLLNDLVSYWALDEVSGTRYDSVGDNDLTDVNSVSPMLRGPIGTVAAIQPTNNEVLSTTTAISGITGPDQMSFSMWLQSTDSEWGPNTLCLQWGYCSAGLYFNTLGTGFYASFTVYDGLYRGAETGWIAPPIAPGSWLHLVFVKDEINDLLKLYVNGVKYQTNWTGSEVRPGASITLNIGYAGAYNSANYGPTGYWGKALSDSEVLTLFNSGNGLTYESLPNDLKTNLVSWWDLSEPSGVRYDSHGSNDLTDNNTVMSVSTAPLGTASTFVAANNEMLYLSGQPINGIKELNFWVKVKDFSNWPLIVGHDHDGRQSEVYLASYNNIYATFYGASDNSQANIGNVPTNEWVFISAYVDPDNSNKATIRMNLNAGGTGGAFSGVLRNGSQFQIGSWLYGAIGMELSSLGVWDYALTEDQRVALFNAGRGVRYVDLSDDIKTGLISWWDLTETSGIRYDSHGSNDLSDYNTVLSVINAPPAMDGAAANIVRANAETLSVALGDAPALKTLTSGDATIAVWVKMGGNLSGEWRSVCAGMYYGTGGYDLYVNYGYPLFTVWDSDGNAHSAGLDAIPSTLNNEWHLFVATWDSVLGKAGLSMDGGAFAYSDAGVTPRTLTDDQKFTVGGRGTDSVYDGVIDELAVWSRILTEDEIAELFNLGRGKYYDFS